MKNLTLIFKRRVKNIKLIYLKVTKTIYGKLSGIKVPKEALYLYQDGRGTLMNIFSTSF